MSSARFEYTHRVGYAECTVGNHIYYARYLDLLDRARGEFFRGLGAPLQQWQDQDTIFPVIESHVRYKSPARYDDLLSIEAWVTAAHGVRLNFAYRLTKGPGTLIAEAETLHVCTGLSEKPKRLPAGLVALLQPYLAARETGAA